MARKKSLNDLHWQVQAHRLIKDEYTLFLQEGELESNPDSAYLFALQKQQNGYREMSERDLILLVAGDLPYMYD